MIAHPRRWQDALVGGYRRRALAWWILHVGLALVVGHGALRGSEGWWSALVQGLGFVAANALLFAIAIGAGLALGRAIDRRWACVLGPWILATSLQILLFSSASHYQIYGYHLDGRSWQMLTRPGAGDMLDMGAGTRARALREVGLLIVAASLIHLVPGTGMSQRADPDQLRHPAMRVPAGRAARWVALALVVAAVVVSPVAAAGQVWWDAMLGATLAAVVIVAVVRAINRRWAWTAAAPALAWALAALAGGAAPVADLAAMRDIGSYALVVEWLLRAPLRGLTVSGWWLLPLTALGAWAIWRSLREPAAANAAPQPLPDPLSASPRPLPPRTLVLLGASLLLIVILDLLLAVGASLSGNRAILEAHRRLGAWHLEPAPLAAVAPSQFPATPADLPAEPRPEPPTQRFDVLIIAIESARADMLDPAVMPNLVAFAAESWLLADHRSTGIESSFGVFGLVSGRLPTWWSSAQAQGYTPAWLQVLAAAGYRRAVWSCTTVANPDFRRALFAELPAEAIHDHWPEVSEDQRYARDEHLTSAVIAEMVARAEERAPSFAYLFYDASHFPYTYPPPGHDPAMSVDAVDVPGLVDADPATLTALRNRYRNALRHVDSQLGRVFAALREHDRLERTVVVVVGDHGEEFGELGSWGGHIIHNGAFDRHQAGTVGVVRVPSATPRLISAPTSHIDIVPTILAALGMTGADLPGRDLAAPLPTERRTPVVGYDEFALIDQDWRVLRVGRPPGDAWFWALHDADYHRLETSDQVPAWIEPALEPWRERGLGW